MLTTYAARMEAIQKNKLAEKTATATRFVGVWLALV
jgi:hypothetical protein